MDVETCSRRSRRVKRNSNADATGRQEQRSKSRRTGSHTASGCAQRPIHGMPPLRAIRCCNFFSKHEPSVGCMKRVIKRENAHAMAPCSASNARSSASLQQRITADQGSFSQLHIGFPQEPPSPAPRDDLSSSSHAHGRHTPVAACGSACGAPHAPSMSPPASVKAASAHDADAATNAHLLLSYTRHTLPSLSPAQLCSSLSSLSSLVSRPISPGLACALISALRHHAPALTNFDLVSCLSSLSSVLPPHPSPSPDLLPLLSSLSLGALTTRELLTLTLALPRLHPWLLAPEVATAAFLARLHYAWPHHFHLLTLPQLDCVLTTLQLPSLQPIALRLKGAEAKRRWLAAFEQEAAGKLYSARREWYAGFRAESTAGEPSGTQDERGRQQQQQQNQSTAASDSGSVAGGRWLPGRKCIAALHAASSLPGLMSSLTDSRLLLDQQAGQAEPGAEHIDGQGVGSAAWVELWANSHAVLRHMAPAAGQAAGDEQDEKQRGLGYSGLRGEEEEEGSKASGACWAPEGGVWLGGQGEQTPQPNSASSRGLAEGGVGSDAEEEDTDALLVALAEAAAKLRRLLGACPPPGWQRALLRAADRRAPNMRPAHVAALVSALARLRSGTCQARAGQQGGQGGSKGSRSGEEEEGMRAVADRLADVLPMLSPARLADVCVALPRLAAPHTPRLAAALVAAALRSAHAVGPAGLAALALALADSQPNDCLSNSYHPHGNPGALQWGPGLEVGGVGDGLGVQRCMLGAADACMLHLGAGEAATLAASVARLGWQPDVQWMDKFLSVLVRLLPKLRPHQLARTCWALVRMGCRPRLDWWRLVVREAAGKMSQFEARDHALLMWALATAARDRSEDDPVPVHLGSRNPGNGSGSQQQEGGNPALRCPPSAPTALASAPLLSAHWLRHLYDKAGCQLRSADAQSLAILGWALAALGLRPEPVFMSSWCAAAERRFGSANSQDLAQMVWAAASMGYRPSQQWCERLCIQLHAVSPSPNSQDLANAAWALSTLSFRPPPAWVDRHLAMLLDSVQEEVRQADEAVAAARLHARPDRSAAAAAVAARARGQGSAHVTATLLSLGRVTARPLTLLSSTAWVAHQEGQGSSAQAAEGDGHVVAELLRLQVRLLPHALPASLPGAAACLLQAGKGSGMSIGAPYALRAPGSQSAGLAAAPLALAASEPSAAAAAATSTAASEPATPAVRAVPAATLREALGALLLASGRHMPLLSPRGLVQLGWALARMGVQPGDRWTHRYFTSLLLVAPSLEPGLRTMALWMLAKTGWGRGNSFVAAPGGRGATDELRAIGAAAAADEDPRRRALVAELSAGVADWAAACGVPPPGSLAAAVAVEASSSSDGVSRSSVSRSSVSRSSVSSSGGDGSSISSSADATYAAAPLGRRSSPSAKRAPAPDPPPHDAAPAPPPVRSSTRYLPLSLWALAVLGVRPGVGWWPPVLLTSGRMLLATSVAARAEARNRRGRRFAAQLRSQRVQLGQQSEQQLQDGVLSPRDLARLLWGLGRLKVRPPPSWCAAARACVIALLPTLVANPLTLAVALSGLARCMRPAFPRRSRRRGVVRLGLHPGQALARSVSEVLLRAQERLEGAAGAAGAGACVGGATGGASISGAGGAAPDSPSRPPPLPPGLNSHSLAMLLCASVKLGLPLGPHERAAALALARQLLRQPLGGALGGGGGGDAAQRLVATCWALRRLGCQPSVAWRQEVQALAEARWAEPEWTPSLRYTFMAILEAWARAGVSEGVRGITDARLVS